MNKLLELLRPKSFRDVVLHFLIVVGLGFTLIVLFFNVYLPSVTQQGETVAVPNLKEKTVQELAAFLEERELGYFIQDSSYNPDKPPLTVFMQHPEPGSKVKKGRKIFVSITAAVPPEVEMPDLRGRSVINAEDELNSFGLKVDSVSYVPDLQQNAVLKQLYQGKPIEPGTRIQKGERISLVVGDGLGTQEFEVPDLIGKEADEAEFVLLGSNLQVGGKVYDPEADAPKGSVIKQKPDAGETIRIGDFVDLWIAGEEPEPDTLATDNQETQPNE